MQNPSPRPQPASAATFAVDSAGLTSTAGSAVGYEPAPTSRRNRRERYRQRQTLIQHLFFVENWPRRLIAQQLKISLGSVILVINRAARLDAEVTP